MISRSRRTLAPIHWAAASPSAHAVRHADNNGIQPSRYPGTDPGQIQVQIQVRSRSRYRYRFQISKWRPTGAGGPFSPDRCRFLNSTSLIGMYRTIPYYDTIPRTIPPRGMGCPRANSHKFPPINAALPSTTCQHDGSVLGRPYRRRCLQTDTDIPGIQICIYTDPGAAESMHWAEMSAAAEVSS